MRRRAVNGEDDETSMMMKASFAMNSVEIFLMQSVGHGEMRMSPSDSDIVLSPSEESKSWINREGGWSEMLLFRAG